MRLTTVTVAALLGYALAAPAPQPPNPDTYENIDIADLSVRKELNGTISNVYFSLSGENATDLVCKGANPTFPSAVITCGESKYRFALYPGKTEQFALRIYHELGLGFGFYGEGEIFTYCHAGGLDSLICSQQYPTTIVIDSIPDPSS